MNTGVREASPCLNTVSLRKTLRTVLVEKAWSSKITYKSAYNLCRLPFQAGGDRGQRNPPYGYPCNAKAQLSLITKQIPTALPHSTAYPGRMAQSLYAGLYDIVKDKTQVFAFML
ncbi:hypothetical protein DPSP01_002655 [Paraphaeosphaeria sporulosa]